MLRYLKLTIDGSTFKNINYFSNFVKIINVKFKFD